jgi:hypothetical protein
MTISEIGVGQDVSGLRQRVLYAIEMDTAGNDTYGTPPLTSGTAYIGSNLDTTKFGVIGQLQGDVNFNIDNQLMEIHEAGRINVRNILEKAVNVTVSNIDYYPTDMNFALAAIGDYDTTSPTEVGSLNPKLYTHFGGINNSTSTYTSPVEFEAKSFSLNVGLAGQQKAVLFTGCKAEGITITLNMDEPMKISVDTITARKPYLLEGANVDLDAKFVHANSPPFMYHAGGTLSVDGTTLGNVTEMSVAIKNNLQPVFGMIRSSDKRLLTSLLQGQRSVTGTMTLNYKDDEFVKYLLSYDGTGTTPSESGVKEFDSYILVDNRDTTGYTTGSPNTNYRAIRVDVEDMKLSSVERSHPKDGNVITESFNFTAKNVKLADWNNESQNSW